MLPTEQNERMAEISVHYPREGKLLSWLDLGTQQQSRNQLFTDLSLRSRHF